MHLCAVDALVVHLPFLFPEIAKEELACPEHAWSNLQYYNVSCIIEMEIQFHSPFHLCQ
jgi:hypothetical protein